MRIKISYIHYRGFLGHYLDQDVMRILFTGIKQLSDSTFEDFAEIVIRTYPGMVPEKLSPQDKDSWVNRMQTVHRESTKVNYFGYFKDGVLAGGMILYDFKMTLFETQIEVGGVGLVCVDLLWKKEHIAKKLIEFFHQHYLSQEVTLTCLWPFRSDFYAKMGYAIGKKINQYRFKPHQINSTAKDTIFYLGTEDIPELCSFFNRVASKTHGMILREETQFNGVFKDKTVVGYKRKGNVEGYLAFVFKRLNPDNFILNGIEVQECIYVTRQALGALMAFLKKQGDQIQQIIFNTPDDSFHHILIDSRLENPRMFLTAQACNLQGVGIMYRALNFINLFEQLQDHEFNRGTITVKISISDTFLPENAGSFVVSFQEGRASLLSETDKFDVEIDADVARFTSILLGVATIKDLYSYGLIDISDSQYIGVLDRIFRTAIQPITIEQF